MKEELVELMKDKREFIGYHGTSEASANSILSSNFKPSENPDDWLGYGIYFFIEGINVPIDNAIEWAKTKAWNGRDQPLKYSKYNILSVLVSGKHVLNTSNMDDLNAFNKLREKLQVAEKRSFPRDRNLNEDDRVMWNLVADFLNLEIIIHNLYIKTESQRKLNIVSKVPNTTVMCVKNTNNIHFETIKMIIEGVIRS